ncbi:hypothetical protein OH77DRAFT_1258791 [Trametes cingulata]|nr:hypothetical protein OH77DRAFT_1258791 [Trametes cingulata]
MTLLPPSSPPLPSLIGREPLMATARTRRRVVAYAAVQCKDDVTAHVSRAADLRGRADITHLWTDVGLLASGLCEYHSSCSTVPLYSRSCPSLHYTLSESRYTLHGLAFLGTVLCLCTGTTTTAPAPCFQGLSISVHTMHSLYSIVTGPSYSASPDSYPLCKCSRPCQLATVLHERTVTDSEFNPLKFDMTMYRDYTCTETTIGIMY